jgi:hypothetical protein
MVEDTQRGFIIVVCRTTILYRLHTSTKKRSSTDTFSSFYSLRWSSMPVTITYLWMTALDLTRRWRR